MRKGGQDGGGVHSQRRFRRLPNHIISEKNILGCMVIQPDIFALNKGDKQEASEMIY